MIMAQQWRLKIFEIERDGTDTFVRICNDEGEMLFRWQRGPVLASISVNFVDKFNTFISLCGHFEDPFAFNNWLNNKGFYCAK